MDPENLKQHYLAYIDCLNDRKTHGLEPYVHDTVIHNGKRMTRGEYGTMIQQHMDTALDFHFGAMMVLPTSTEIGAVLLITLTPSREFLGYKPNGRKIVFTEHVFYKFENGRIKQVWSLLDDKAIDKQLGAASSSLPL